MPPPSLRAKPTLSVSAHSRGSGNPALWQKTGSPLARGRAVRTDASLRAKRSAFFDLVDAIGIEGEVVLDRRHRWKRLLVAPDRVLGRAALHRNREITGVAFVGTGARMRAARQQRHVGVGARNIEYRLITGLFEHQRALCIGHRAAGEADADVLFGRRDGDGVVGTGDFHGYDFDRSNYLHRPADSAARLLGK